MPGGAGLVNMTVGTIPWEFLHTHKRTMKSERNEKIQKIAKLMTLDVYSYVMSLCIYIYIYIYIVLSVN